MRIAGISALVGLSLAAACTSGDSSPPNNDTRGIQCTTNFTLTGSFTASQPRPADNTDGCWPVGMWTFSAALDTTMTNSCMPQPTPLQSYAFEGDLTPDTNDPTGPELEVYTYDTDPTDQMIILKVSEGGSGSCQGELDLYSTDGTQVWLFKPETDTIAATTTISGYAIYTVYGSDQWPY